MKYKNIIIVLGLIVVMLQSLGFPQSMRNFIYVLSGTLIVVLSYLSSEKPRQNSEATTTTSNQP